ncbi:MAG TPA: PIG-L deacetylase family protein [Acidimicrobiia bacterium]|jgi:LmbE family N-acetylglucosaminyl deacetylase
MPSPELEPLPEDWDRALAVVAHPDDLEYGAASAVARWTSQGKEVAYLLATAGEAGIDGMLPVEAGPLRMEEERRGARVVGVTTVEFLDHRDGVVEYGLDLRRDVARATRRVRPDVLIAMNYAERWGFGALNQADHRAVGLAAIDGVRDAGNRWVFPELLDEGLEPWSGTKWAFVGAAPDCRHAVDVTDTFERGVDSLREHAAYLEGLGANAMGDPAAFLHGHATETGARMGVPLAVAFELIEL